MHHVVNHERRVHLRLVGPERVSATEPVLLGLGNGPFSVGASRYRCEHVFRSEGPPHRQDRPAHHAGPAPPMLRPSSLCGGCLGLGDRLQPSASGVALPPGGQLLGSLPGAHGDDLRGAVAHLRRGCAEALLDRLLRGGQAPEGRWPCRLPPAQAGTGPGTLPLGILRCRWVPGPPGRGPGCPRAVGAPRPAGPLSLRVDPVGHPWSPRRDGSIST
jgi:hypothetical protein